MEAQQLQDEEHEPEVRLVLQVIDRLVDLLDGLGSEGLTRPEHQAEGRSRDAGQAEAHTGSSRAQVDHVKRLELPFELGDGGHAAEAEPG